MNFKTLSLNLKSYVDFCGHPIIAVLLLPAVVVWFSFFWVLDRILCFCYDVKILTDVYVIGYSKGIYDRWTNAPIDRWEITKQAYADIQELIKNRPELINHEIEVETEKQQKRFFNLLQKFDNLFK